MKIGRRLAMKLLNAAKFVLSLPAPAEGAEVTAPIDEALLAGLAGTVAEATDALERFDYTTALERVERFFWFFCDDYVELVKERAYGRGSGEGAESARRALRLALDTVIRLFAPVLPYTAEETWSWAHDSSVHRAGWPSAAELRAGAGVGAGAAGGAAETAAEGAAAGAELLGAASAAIAAVRKAKSTAKLSMRAEVARVVVAAPKAELDRVRTVADDLRAAGNVAELAFEELEEGAELSVSVELPS
jgi:valyl-tRNA synthetase